MSSNRLIHIKAALIRGAAVLALVIGLSMATGAGAGADDHYVSLSKIFPDGKCSAVIPNFEVMVSQFTGGELTEHKIHDDQGEIVEVITTFINQERDQWATVGSRRDEKVIFVFTLPASVRARSIGAPYNRPR